MIPRFRNGKSIRLCRRQLRLISVLFKFERQFSGQPRIAGTNYEQPEAGLIRVQGTDSWSEDPASLRPVSPAGLGDTVRGGFRCFSWRRVCRVLLPHGPECVCVCVCVKDLLCSTRLCS